MPAPSGQAGSRAFRSRSGPAAHDPGVSAPLALRFLVAALAAVALAVLVDIGRGPVRHRSRPPPAAARAPSLRRTVLLGHSARGRPIQATELGDPRAAVALLLIGCIHGDERAGVAVARALASAEPTPGPHMWVIDELNPDGVATRTRQNARGVDLNRNFPFRWRPLARGSGQFSGPRPLTEPETRIAYRLIMRTRPALTIWLHQPFGVVDESGGNLEIERRFAELTGLPLRRLTRYPGSAAGWQNHALPRSTAMVVELPPGRPSTGEVARLTRAVRALTSRRAGTRPARRLDRAYLN